MDKTRKTRAIRIAVAVGCATALCACAAAVFGLPGGGTDSPPQKDMAIGAADRDAVLEALVATLDRHYVYAGQAATMDKQLRARKAHGDYDAITSADKYAHRLTADLQDMSHDRHLEVRYFEAAIPVPAAGKEDEPDDAAAELAESRRFNFGFETVGRLKCDIGYIDLHEFDRPAAVAGRIEAAMTLLADTHGLIIDLRRMTGGDADTVMMFASKFFDKPTHLNDIYTRDGDRLEARWTKVDAGPTYGQSRPVYLLTSADTFSAGEDFAYALKYAGRATLVGETTGGGAHPGNRRRLGEHFMMNVPDGRAINPVTHTDWEGVGVTPDVAVPAKKALDAAQVALLKKMLETEASPEWQRKIRERLSDLD